MAETTTQVGDQTNSGGAGDGTTTTTTDTTTNDGGAGDGGDSGDKVSYDTHRRLLSEKKRLQADYELLLAEKKEREDAEAEAERKRLESQGEYQKLLEQERKEREKLEGELKAHAATAKEAKKLDAVLTAVGGQIPRKFWGLIDLTAVVINPDSNEVDQMSVTKTVESIRAEYPEIIKTGKSTGLPADAAQSGGNGSLTVDGWKNLPLAEQKKRLPEYVEMLRKQQGGVQ